MIIDLARLLSQLQTSGLSQRDQPLFQIISQLIKGLQDVLNTLNGTGTGTSSIANAITGLNQDVFATGPGVVPAIIQPQAVTYVKIQDTILADILLGRAGTPGTVQEILLGSNLTIIGNTLEISTPGGGTGLLHNLLSLTHPDTLPDNPVLGDLIYAGSGTTFVGTYVNAVILNVLENDLPLGIYGWLYLGFDGNGLIAPVSGAISILTIDLIPPTLPETWLTWDLIDAVILNPIQIDNSIGIWSYLNALVPGQTEPGPGVNGAITTIPFDLIPTPSPTPFYSLGLWRRKAIGVEDEVLIIDNGIPEWSNSLNLSGNITGNNLISVNEIFERSRSVSVGTWIDYTFNAANFTATGGVGPTWTVAAGDYTRFQYKIVGNSVTIAVYLKNTTVGGTATTRLIIQLPFTLVGEFAMATLMRENSVLQTDTAVAYNSTVGLDKLHLEKVPFGTVFDMTANETYVGFIIDAQLA